MENGYTRLFRWRGVPVLAHWSIVFGLLIVGGGFRWNPAAWLGFVLIVLIHEMGHAWLAMNYRRRVLRIEMTAMGGLCVYEGGGPPIQRAVIAWGGVLGQMLLLGAVLVAQLIGLWPTGLFFLILADTLIRFNLFIAGFNLLPFRGLDGGEAWKVFTLGRKPRPRRSTSDRLGWKLIRRPREGVDIIDAPSQAAIDELVDEALDDAKAAAKKRQDN